MFIEGFELEADPDGEHSGGKGKGTGPETDGVENSDALDMALSGAKTRRAEKAT